MRLTSTQCHVSTSQCRVHVNTDMLHVGPKHPDMFHVRSRHLHVGVSCSDVNTSAVPRSLFLAGRFVGCQALLEFAGEGPIEVHHDRPLDENIDLVPLQMQVDVVE